MRFRVCVVHQHLLPVILLHRYKIKQISMVVRRMGSLHHPALVVRRMGSLHHLALVVRPLQSNQLWQQVRMRQHQRMTHLQSQNP